MANLKISILLKENMFRLLIKRLYSMIRKFNLLFVMLIICLNFTNSCSCNGNGDGNLGNDKCSISNDSLAYIMGELVGQWYHKENLNFMYQGQSLNFNKVAEKFDTVNELCSNKGFLDGLCVYFFTQRICQMLHEEDDFDINPAELRIHTLRMLEDSTNFISRDGLSQKKNYYKECINNKDTVSIYKIFGGYLASSIANMMKKENNIFVDCKKEINNGINYSDNIYDKPTIDGFGDYIAIEAAMNLWSMAVEANYSPQIAAEAFRKTLVGEVVKSKKEKEQLLDSSLEKLLEEYDGIENRLVNSPL